MTRISSFLGLSGLIFLTFIIDTNAFDNSVYILSKYRQHVTSSTLNWLPVAHYNFSKDNLVIGGFASHRSTDGNGVNNQADNAGSDQNAIYVCRVSQNGVLVAGRMVQGHKSCTVAYLGNVHSYDRYELLENVDNAARLNWESWDGFRQAPIGAVAAETTYVARYPAKDEDITGIKGVVYTHYIGTYDSSESLGKITYVKNDGTEGTESSGEILVETEPVFYELNAVKFNNHKRDVVHRSPRILHEATISNTGENAAEFAQALDYSFNYTIYWGQGRAMIRALNTSVTNVDGKTLGHIAWGIKEETVKSDAAKVEIRLDPGTAINVTLRANYTEVEIPYTGDLVSLYADGVRRTRVVNGVCKEDTMTDVHVELGPIYFLSNMSLVPTTLPPPSTKAVITTTTTTVTVTTATTKTADDGNRNNNRTTTSTTSAMDENMIVPRKNSETGNIQNDDGGPLSLKDKEGSPSGSFACPSFAPSITVMAITAIVFHRIT